MSSQHAATSFGDIDGPTTDFLSRIAEDISYLHRETASTPTDERFYKEGVETYEVGKLKIDGSVITIYSFDGGRVFNTLQQRADDPSTGGGTDQFFAVDWPVEQENGQSYKTFYFKSRPSEISIRKAHHIFQVKIAIENREVLQEFRCQSCSERVHWTNLKNDDTMTLCERVIMLQKQVCNCEGSLELLEEGLDEAHIIPPGDSSPAAQEHAVSHTD